MSVIVISRIVAGLVFVVMGYIGWKQIPAEDPETVAARKEYGKAE